MWHDMECTYMASFKTVSIISRCGPTIKAHCRNQTNKNLLALYNPLLHFYSHLKQLYISNKAEHFSYKDGCDVHGNTCNEMIKRKAGLGYR